MMKALCLGLYFCGCWEIRTFVKKGINLWCLSQLNRRDPKALIAPAHADVPVCAWGVCASTCVCVCVSVLFSCHLHFPASPAFAVCIYSRRFIASLPKGKYSMKLAKRWTFLPSSQRGGSGGMFAPAWQELKECKRIYVHTHTRIQACIHSYV